jgi:putative glutamine amidotransferase
MQLLNVVYGGDLVQHLADVVDLEQHRPAPGTFGRHRVALDGDTTARSMLGEDVVVHSTHHQGVGRVGEGLVVSGRAPDGTIEALEDPQSPFCVGVLWHPEEEAGAGGAPLFWGLVEAARAYRERNGGGAR